MLAEPLHQALRYLVHTQLLAIALLVVPNDEWAENCPVCSKTHLYNYYTIMLTRITRNYCITLTQLVHFVFGSKWIAHFELIMVNNHLKGLRVTLEERVITEVLSIPEIS